MQLTAYLAQLAIGILFRHRTTYAVMIHSNLNGPFFGYLWILSFRSHFVVF